MSSPNRLFASERLASVFAVLVGGALMGFAFTPPNHSGGTETLLSPFRLLSDLRSGEHGDAHEFSRTFGEVAELLRPSLVHIDCVLRETARVEPAAANSRIGGDSDEGKGELEGIGSGVIVTTDGYILTNSHLVRNAQNIEVKLADGASYKADVVGADSHTEVSVLKIDASGLVPVEFGDSDALAVGDWVLAMGNPYGLDHTVTAGIISAKGRSNLGIAGQEEFLQTDAAINPGNSGGPLVNLNGKVVGINTAIASKTGGSTGIGFAIPAKLARTVMQAIIDDGGIQRGWMGLAVQELTADMAQSFEFDGAGVLISDVQPNGPAQQAGLRAGDIVLSFAGERIEDPARFRNLIASTPPGVDAELEVFREGNQQSVGVKLMIRPEDEQAKTSSTAKSKQIKQVEAPEAGAEVHDLTPELAHRLGMDGARGALVTKVIPGTIAARAGLRVGDVVVLIGSQEVRNAEQFDELMKQQELEKGVRIQVRSLGGIRRFVLLKSSLNGR
jgi:serine protease Do